MDPDRRSKTKLPRALVVWWLLSVVLAAALGGIVGRFGFPGGAGGGGATPMATGTGATTDSFLQGIADRAKQDASAFEQLLEETEEVEASVDRKPAPVAAAPVRQEPTAPEPVQPEPTAVVALRGAELLAGVNRIDRLFENGDRATARAEAENLLAPHRSYTGLVAAQIDAGAIESLAQLNAVRVLQVAGHDLISRELARELKRSYAGTQSVADSIWEWGVLSPLILSTESTVERGRTVVVLGTVRNPDIGVVRRVQVEVEALDAAGNRLAVVELRIRPKVIGAGETADFSASFKGLDPASVVRTRATVLKWESEVLSPG